MSVEATSQAINPTVQAAIFGLLGVILGSLLNFIQGIISNHYAAKREKEAWNRQKQDRDSQKYDEAKIDKEKTIKTALSSTSGALISIIYYSRNNYDQRAASSEDMREMFSQSIRQVAEGVALILNSEDSAIKRDQIIKEYGDFLSSPELYAKKMLESIYTYSEETKKIPGIVDSRKRKFKTVVSEIRRKMMFSKGLLVEEMREFELNIEEMTDIQRKALWDVYGSGIIKPDVYARLLFIPEPMPHGGFQFNTKAWETNLPLDEMSPREILEAWANDVNTILADP